MLSEQNLPAKRCASHLPFPAPVTMSAAMTQFRTLVEALESAPGDRPFVTAWIDEDERETVTFGDFRRRARSQAHLLQTQSITQGDRVVIIMPQGIAGMAAFVGAMMLGAVPAFIAYPNFKIEPSKYRSGLAGVTANLGAKIVVIDQEFPDDMLAHVSLNDRSANDGSGLLRASNESASLEREQTTSSIQPHDLAFIQHSAGTTGLQKGVALTHAAVLRQIEHLKMALSVDETTDRIYSWLPLYHDMGLIACFMLPMVCHIPVVMQSPLDWVMQPETMLQVISDYKCTLAWLPNFAFQFVPRRMRRNREAHYDLSSLRALINCSEPVRAASMNEFAKNFTTAGLKPQALQSCYAMAENVFAVTQSDINRPPACVWAEGVQFRKKHLITRVPEGTRGAMCFTSSGKLLPNHEVRVISEDGSTLIEGHVGEILIKSDCRFDGYYNRVDLTAQAIEDDWYRTGDLGFLLDGELYVVGRKKDLIIVGGENLYPQDIEEIVARNPAIHDGRTVAMGVCNADLGTEDVVVVAEVEDEAVLARAAEIEQEIRDQVVAGMGVAVRRIFLKPPKWIVKSTAGKPARSSTREKLLHEHPELNVESQEGQLA